MNDAARFEGAIFDVDGVLVASPHERAWRESLEKLMSGKWVSVASASSYAPSLFTSAFYQQVMAGKPRLSGAQAALEAFGVPDADLRAVEYAAQKQEQMLQLIEARAFEAFPDAVPFVFELKALGLRLAACSSSKNARQLLVAIDPGPYRPASCPADPAISTLLDLFDVDVSGRDLPMGKPDPSIFLLGARELGLDPAQCLVVEDAPSGIEAGRAGGMRTLGVARANDEAFLLKAGADLVVPSLDAVDLPALADGRLEARRTFTTATNMSLPGQNAKGVVSC